MLRTADAVAAEFDVRAAAGVVVNGAIMGALYRRSPE
jgi:hypothetical protein